MRFIKKEVDLKFIKKWMQTGINPIILAILDRRKLISDSDIINSIFPVFENILSPFLFEDIIKAYERINKAIADKEKILIFGDRDVDGTSSISILFDYLENINANVSWEVPVKNDPYGLNKNKFNKWIKNGINLCITVDCGITNLEEIKLLKESNIDSIIIDHHEPHSNLPDAYAIINPKSSKTFPFTYLAACGVVFLFIIGHIIFNSHFFNRKSVILYGINSKYYLDIYTNLHLTDTHSIKNLTDINKFNIDDLYIYDTCIKNPDNIFKSIKSKIIKLQNITKIYKNKLFEDISLNLCTKLSFYNYIFERLDKIENLKKKYLPLVMLGTIADIMPIIDINRIFTHLGFYYLKKNPSENFINLFDQIKLDINTIDSKDISWIICPLLNSPGRLGDANKTVNFLLNKNKNSIVKEIININTERKIKGDKAFKNFSININENKNFYNNHLTFFYSDEIDRGITGITALKISKQTKSPSIVAAKEGDFYSGSIRGDGNFHFVQFLEKAKHLFTQYGGHKNAAGFRFSIENLDDFKNFLLYNSIAFENNNEDDVLYIDAEIPSAFLDINLFKMIKLFEPYGEKNINPILYTSNIQIDSFFRLGESKKHLKLYFNTDTNKFTGLFWNKGEWFENYYTSGSKYNIIYQLEINKFNKNLIPQLILLDMERS
ncbi:MAG: single-stranded-DNA-specific exonuclease RecJ [Spirochaetes bacterium]|nr:single-stranded-DNA-specific exonuclease RecJ [Spirochaetota bacterium]